MFYRSVLLLDNKIVNWKAGPHTVWRNVDEAFNNRQFSFLWRESNLNLSIDFKEYKNEQDFMNDYEWFDKWVIHERVRGMIYEPFGMYNNSGILSINWSEK